MEQLPPRIPDQKLLALLGRILSIDGGPVYDGKLRLDLLAKSTSLQALVDLTDAQQVLIPLVWSLMRRSLLLPQRRTAAPYVQHDEAAVQLQSIYRDHLRRRERQREQLSAIIAALNHKKIEPLLLKGARSLFAPSGSWEEAREMRDLDLLILPHESARATEILIADGYTIDPRPMPIDQHLPEMWHSHFPSAVEIHTHSLAFSARELLPTEDVWRLAIRQSAEKSSYFVLPDEWHLLHGLLNHEVADRGYIRQLLALKPLWEFAMRGAGMSEAGWHAIANHMVSRNAYDILSNWTLLASNLYSFRIPYNLQISQSAHAHAARTLSHAAAPEWSRRARFLKDQLVFAFSRQTLATRYKLDPSNVGIGAVYRHFRFLVRRYRGQVVARIFGGRDG